jgi:hypothetical protein
MNVFKVCVFYIIIYINLLNIKIYLYNIAGNNVQEMERDVISRENLNLYRQHHSQLSNIHSLTYRRDLWNIYVAPYSVNPVKKSWVFAITLKFCLFKHLKGKHVAGSLGGGVATIAVPNTRRLRGWGDGMGGSL